jgi:hypothetical protein
MENSERRQMTLLLPDEWQDAGAELAQLVLNGKQEIPVSIELGQAPQDDRLASGPHLGNPTRERVDPGLELILDGKPGAAHVIENATLLGKEGDPVLCDGPNDGGLLLGQGLRLSGLVPDALIHVQRRQLLVCLFP